MIKKIALVGAAIMTFMSIGVSAAKNPYNEMDAINVSNRTIEEVALLEGITFDEFKAKYGLPADMPQDTNEEIASGYLPFKVYANDLGVSVEDAIKSYGLENSGIEITGETLRKDIYKPDNSALRLALADSGFLSYDDGDEILVMIKGKYVDFDVAPVIQDNRVLVPMRNIFTALGAEVSWQNDVQTVIATRGKDVIAMQLGQNILYKNNERIEIPTASVAKDGRILVPIRAVSEALDTEVFYNGNTKTVVIH